MRHAATELIKLRLKSIAGREHDDLELLSSHIVSAAEWITLSQLTNGTIDDEQIVRTMAGFVGQNAGVNMGIENDVIRDLIYRTFYFFLESGYLLQ